jgi:hypothetical protein
VSQPVPTLIGGSVSLKPAQEIVLASLEERGTDGLTRSEYEVISGVSRSQAAYDIAELVSLGILERVGSGRATRYRLPGGGAGRPKKWTDDLIRAQLRELHSELGRWPRAADFRESGRSDLYVAACRNGGIDRWARELAPDTVEEPEAARESDSRTWLSYALVLAAILGVLTVVGPRPRPPATVGGEAARFDDAKAAARAALASLESLDAGRAVLVLTADEDVDLTVRRGSATGRTVFSGQLLQGASVRVVAPRIWVEVSSAAALSARLGGEALRLPSRPAVIVITPAGIRSVKRPPIEQAQSAPVASAPEQTVETAAPSTPVTVAPPAPTTSSASASSPSPDAQPSPDSPPGPFPDPDRPSP